MVRLTASLFATWMIRCNFVNNDVDAFRHAYVSGRYTQEYGSRAADILGIINEFSSTLSPGSGVAEEQNMDVWNN